LDSGIEDLQIVVSNHSNTMSIDLVHVLIAALFFFVWLVALFLLRPAAAEGSSHSDTEQDLTL
jgi:hypothetical protein